MSFESSSNEPEPQSQKKSFRTDKQVSETPHLNASQGSFVPATSEQADVNSSAISPPQGIRSRWSNTTQKPVIEKTAHPKDNSTRNRKMFLIALVTMAPILAVVSAIASDPRFGDVMQNPQKQALLARTFGRASQGFPPVALMLYEQAHNLDPAEPNYLTDIGLVKLNTFDTTGAKAAFISSIKIKPTPRALNDLGICYDREGKPQQAIQTYNDCLAMDSGWAMAWNNRGLAFGQLKQYDKSISDYSQAIKLRYATAYFGRCESYGLMGRADLAARDAEIIRRHGYTNTAFCFMSADPPADEL